MDNKTAMQMEGWAPMGRACVRHATFLRGQRFSVLPALTSDGIIALDMFEGLVTKEKFIVFGGTAGTYMFSFVCSTFIYIILQAPQLQPYPGPHSVVVLDNCAIHHDEDVRQIVKDECGKCTTNI